MKSTELLGGVAVCALLATGLAVAEDHVVSGVETVPRVLPGVGDTLLIAETGAITSSSPATVLMTNGNQSLTNLGLLRQTSAYDKVIHSTGNHATIDNRGEIYANWVGMDGIFSTGDDARLFNSGLISAYGNDSDAIFSSGARASIINSGEIRFGVGLSTLSPSVAINSTGADAVILNSGRIVAICDSDPCYARGVYANGANATVTNSGTIIVPELSPPQLGEYHAIFFDTGSSNPTLNLLAGSAIQGRIFARDSLTVSIGPGLNTVLTVDAASGLAAVNAYGAPVLVDPLGYAVVVDPTGFSVQDEMVNDLTRSIVGALDQRSHSDRFGLWGTGFGSARDQGAAGPNVDFTSGLGGLVVGLDGEFVDGMRVGGFMGAATMHTATDTGSQAIDVQSFYAGIYGSLSSDDYFLDLSLTGGTMGQSSDRMIADNTVEGGISHALADYNGFFISPSATIGASFATDGGTFTPSLRARYTGLLLDAYEENGSAANLMVDERALGVIDLRAQIAYAPAPLEVSGGTLQATIRAGVDAVIGSGDSIDASVLGSSFLDGSLAIDADLGSSARGFAGLDLTWQADDGLNLFAGAELGYDSTGAFTTDLKVGLKVAF